MALTYDEISEAAAFDAIRDDWARLLDAAGVRGLYVRHEWLRAWWDGFGRAGDLRVGLVRRDGRLVGAAPMMRSRRTVGGLPVRSVQTLGVNFGYVEIPVDSRDSEAMGRLVTGLLRGGGADIFLFKAMPAGGESERRLHAALDSAGARWIEHEHREALLDASGGPTGYEAGRSRKLWRNIRSRRRRLEEQGSVRIERHRGLGRDATVWEEIFGVSLRSWKGEAKSAVGLKPEYREFLRSLVARFGERSEAEVWILRLNDGAIAYRVGCRSGAAFLECEIAYDQAWATYSPGTLLAASANEALVAEGVTEIDLGIAFPWKEEWSPVHRSWSEVVAFAPGNLYAAAAYRWARSRRRAPAGGGAGSTP